MTDQSTAGGSVYDVTPTQIGGFNGAIGLGTKVVKDNDNSLPGGSPWGIADKTLLQMDWMGSAGWSDVIDVAQVKTVRVRKAPLDISSGQQEGTTGWYNRTGELVKAGQWYIQVSNADVYGDTLEVTSGGALIGRTASGPEGSWDWEGDGYSATNDLYVNGGWCTIGSSSNPAGIARALVPDIGQINQWCEFSMQNLSWDGSNLGPILRHTFGSSPSYWLWYLPTPSPVFVVYRGYPPSNLVEIGRVSAVGLIAGKVCRFEVVDSDPVVLRIRQGSSRWQELQDSSAERLTTGTRAGYMRYQPRNPMWGNVRFGSL